jgi:organic hydroperoxide reductase OsmC/OhrA
MPRIAPLTGCATWPDSPLAVCALQLLWLLLIFPQCAVSFLEEYAMNEQLPYFYETTVAWTSERKGELHSPGLASLDIAAPPEFKGHAGLWTPEHLYVASVNACFMTTFLAIAEMSKFEFARFTCTATGKLEKAAEHGYHITEVTLKPQLVIAHSRDLERAGRLLEKTEANCLISNSIKTTVRLLPEISLIGAPTTA